MMKTIFVTLLYTILFFMGCSPILLVNSSREDKNIIVDGDEKDWNNKTFYLNQQNILLGVRNDEEYLYLFLKIVDRQQIRNIRMAGLTIWLDPNGSDSKSYGIRIPGKPVQREDISENDQQPVSAAVTEIGVLTKGKKEPVFVPIVERNGIQFATSRTPESMIMECRIPLKENPDNPMQWTAAGPVIGITLETGEMKSRKKEDMSADLVGTDNRAGGYPAGGMGHGGGTRKDGEGEVKRGENRAPLDFWFKVRLAESK